MTLAGIVFILIGAYLIDSVIKGRPLRTIVDVIADPSRAQEIIDAANGTAAKIVPAVSAGRSGGVDGSDAPATRFTVVENGLQPHAKAVLRVVVQQFPWITTVYGRGARPIATSDHPMGNAVDFMIPQWQTSEGKARGWEVANFALANASDLSITHIIFSDKQWTPSRAAEGWRPYRHPNGASATLRHLDHVHVSAKARTS